MRAALRNLFISLFSGWLSIRAPAGVTGQIPRADAQRCTASETSRRGLADSAGHPVFIEPLIVSAGANGEILLLGRYNYVFHRTSPEAWAPVRGDSVIGALVTPGKPAAIIHAPVPTALLDGIRAARRPDGSWDVVFAELQPVEGEARSPFATSLWHGVLEGARWTTLDRIPTPPVRIERAEQSSSLVRWGDSLAWAVPYHEPGHPNGLLLLTRRDGAAWDSEVLSLPHAYTELMHDSTAGLVLATVQPDPKLRSDGNSLLFWTRNPEWRIHGTVVPGARERVHRPTISAASGNDVVLTWEAVIPGAAGERVHEAHAMAGRLAFRNERVIRLDDAVVPLRAITYVPLAHQRFWVLEHGAPSEDTRIRVVRDSAGSGVVGGGFATPFVSATVAAAASPTELVIAGGVLESGRSFVQTVLLGFTVTCESPSGVGRGSTTF